MRKSDKTAAIVLTLFVWGLAGALFGSLFAALYELLLVLGLSGWQAIIAGTTIAAVTTATFYSAMPIALVGAMAGVLASLATLMAGGHDIQLLPIATAAGVTGLLAGSFYAWMVRGGGRPLAETITGLFSGVAAGGAMAVGLGVYGGEVSMLILGAGVVTLVGSLFQLSERWIVSTLSGRFPRLLSAPLVAGLIAAVVGASFWVISGATANAVDGSTKLAIDHVLGEVPAGFLGGMLGGAITGMLLELMGVHIEEHDQSA